MNILIVTPLYTPDLGPSAPLFEMLSKGLVQRGHRVTVIAAVPHYPSGYVSPTFRGKLVYRSMEDGVEVFRVRIPSLNRDNLGKRMFQLLTYQIGASLLSLAQKYDAAIMVNPALASWMPLALSTLIRQKPVIYSIHDVYPDVGIKLGIFRNRSVVSAVTFLERFCVDHSTRVRILSASFKPGVRALGVSDSKMALIYDWVDTDLIIPMQKDNKFSQEYGLNDKFIILYAGNIGLSQGLENILITSEMLADQKDILFVYVGDGKGRKYLQSLVEQKHLSNVQFVDFQPRERLPEVLASADVSLVILRRGIGLESLPSKTFSIMASGRPLIASVDEESETWNLVKQADAGICIAPENPTKIAEAILTLKNDITLRQKLGNNGRIWAEQHHSPQYASEQFERLLQNAVLSSKLNDSDNK